MSLYKIASKGTLILGCTSYRYLDIINNYVKIIKYIDTNREKYFFKFLNNI